MNQLRINGRTQSPIEISQPDCETKQICWEVDSNGSVDTMPASNSTHFATMEDEFNESI